MGVSEATSVWAVLLPVIVGGLLGLMGGILGPTVSHFLNEKNSRKIKRLERFEQLMDAVYQHDHWLSAVRDQNAFGAEKVTAASPLFQARTIASVYFPEMLAALDDLNIGTLIYKGWIYKAAQLRINNQIDKIIEGQDEAYDKYLLAFSSFQRKAAEFALTLGARK